jgi:uncharacterized protein (UPF0264 family)
MRAIRAAVGAHVGVIAAAYADAAVLDPPAVAPSALPEIVAASAIDGALVDTYVKDGRGLFDWLSEAQLDEMRLRTHAAGGTFGVAGRLRIADLSRVRADLVGMRSGVCRDGDRVGEIDPQLVAEAVARLAEHVSRA